MGFCCQRWIGLMLWHRAWLYLVHPVSNFWMPCSEYTTFGLCILHLMSWLANYKSDHPEVSESMGNLVGQPTSV